MEEPVDAPFSQERPALLTPLQREQGREREREVITREPKVRNTTVTKTWTWTLPSWL